MMQFHKYHALGNDYIVVDPRDHPAEFSVAEIVRLCDRHFGIGSDGILWGPLFSDSPIKGGVPFSLRIFNPDGGEAQKSGNGLRIFCRFLFDQGLVATDPFRVHTAGGTVTATVHPDGRAVTVEMGKASFRSDAIPVLGPAREVIGETLVVAGQMLTIHCASMGNPHCVVDFPNATEADARRLGPLIENHAMFPQRTNVQFLTLNDRSNITIRIWERGAGYTLASGSSASAAAALAHRLGMVGNDVRVHMPGGEIAIQIGNDNAITMTGPVTKVARGTWSNEMLEGM
jgi:diaminopimelate epimerase